MSDLKHTLMRSMRLAALLGSAGCGAGRAAPATRAALTTGTALTTEAARATEAAPATSAPRSASSEVGVTNRMASDADMSRFDDPELAAIALTMHECEVREALLAQNKAHSADVKRFATDMVVAHRDMMARTRAVLVRLQMTPSGNAVSNELKIETQSQLTALGKVRGREFDRDYVDTQVTNHDRALDLLARLTPNVRRSELKTALASDRPRVEARLRAAERVQGLLQARNPGL